MKVAIIGAGIAGTTLAWWLRRYGHEVLLVERSPALRSDGYVVDLWGIGYDVAEHMGLLPELLRLQYRVEDIRLVDAQGHAHAGYPARLVSLLSNDRMLALSRADIARAIYTTLDDRVEVLFGETIATIEERADCVELRFNRAGARHVDLVIGADGLHSQVREQVFGPERAFVFPLGCHVAAFEVAGYRHRDPMVSVARSTPGRYLSRLLLRDDRTLFLMIFLDTCMEGARAETTEECKAVLARIFGHVGWEATEILAALKAVDELYFDSASQIRMNHWSRGRTALVGDAAACPSLIAGEGAGLAIAGAYVLAGELQRCNGDHAAAFVAYERILKPFIETKQRRAVQHIRSFVPSTALGLRIRDFATRLMRLPVFPELLMGRTLKDTIELPHYDA